MINKIKKGMYVLAGTLAPAFAFAATSQPAATASSPLADKFKSVGGTILSDGVLSNLGALIAAIGTVIVIWKVAQLVFGNGDWSQEVKMIMGGIIVMIIGTNFVSIVGMIAPGLKN